MDVRDGRVEDADALAAIDQRVLADGRGVVRTADQATSAAAYREHLGPDPDRRFLVAMDGGEVVGHGTLHRPRVAYGRHMATVAVQVDPQHQGRGVGRGLVEALVRWSDDQGLERLQLQVRADNHRAIRLYRSVGFAIESRRVGFLRTPSGEYLDDLAMLRLHRPVAFEKAAAAIVRVRAEPEICLFGTPGAGWQVPKGTIEPGEDPAAAAVREAAEETGLSARIIAPLGTWCLPVRDTVHRWHGFWMEAPGAPDRWDHRATGSVEEEGVLFELRWVPLRWADEVVPPLYHELIDRTRAELAQRAVSIQPATSCSG